MTGKAHAHLVTAANQRAASYVKEAHTFGNLLPAIKFCRFDVAIDFHVPLRRAHVLAESYNIDVDFAKFYAAHLTQN